MDDPIETVNPVNYLRGVARGIAVTPAGQDVTGKGMRVRTELQGGAIA